MLKFVNHYLNYGMWVTKVFFSFELVILIIISIIHYGPDPIYLPSPVCVSCDIAPFPNAPVCRFCLPVQIYKWILY